MGCTPSNLNRIQSVYPVTEQQKKTMKKSWIYKPCPDMVKLTPGQIYHYCSCGLSKSQPFCDGSHEGTIFKPIQFTVTNATNFLCLCKRSKTGPFCDNEHKKYMKFDLDF